MPPTLTLLPLLVTAGLLALILLWPRVRSGLPGTRLAAEVLVSTVALAPWLYGLIMTAQHQPW